MPICDQTYSKRKRGLVGYLVHTKSRFELAGELLLCFVCLRSSLAAAADSAALQSPQAQLSQLEAKVDGENVQLATILSCEVQLQEALESLGEEPDARLLAGIQEQQATLGLRKKNVLKRLEQLQQERQRITLNSN